MITLRSKIGTFNIPTMSLSDICMEKNLVASRSEFKRLLREGAIHHDDKRLDEDSIIWRDREVVAGEFKATIKLPVMTML
jgi:tyrosyl-tRNA synthetase